ncbi:hypothetical protein DFH27DRAFT_528233 [Peziza echinospora]|nr:hypothetical protein DFH27DRAFT_528233 [Peziza echinospora]
MSESEELAAVAAVEVEGGDGDRGGGGRSRGGGEGGGVPLPVHPDEEESHQEQLQDQEQEQAPPITTTTTIPASPTIAAAAIPTPSTPPSSSPDLDEGEKKLLRRLEQKRKEVDEDIEAYRAMKEEEYAAFERRLRRRRSVLLQQQQERRKVGESEEREGELSTTSGSGPGEGGSIGYDDGDEESAGGGGEGGETVRRRHLAGVKNGGGALHKEDEDEDEEGDREVEEEEEDVLPFAISSPEGLLALETLKIDGADVDGDESGFAGIGVAAAQPDEAALLSVTVIPVAATTSDATTIATTTDSPGPSHKVIAQNLAEAQPVSDNSNSTTSTSTISTSSAATIPERFDEGLQAAGLFTPRYLPLLLDDTFSRSSSTKPLSVFTDLDSPTSSPIAAAANTVPARPTTPIRTSVPITAPTSSSSISGGSANRATSPGAPLASSLKNSASSGFSSSAASARNLKLKSPKKVSFKLDETKAVPSRSTPPQTILTFQPDEEDPEAVDIEQLETLDDLASAFTAGQGRATVTTTTKGTTVVGGGGGGSGGSGAGRAMPKSVIVDRMSESPASSLISQGLVTPLTTNITTILEDGSVVQLNSLSSATGDRRAMNTFNSNNQNSAAVIGLSSAGGHDHDDWESVEGPHVNGDEDDDEEDLFDMDETIPLSPEDLVDVSSSAPVAVLRPVVEFDQEAIWAGVTALSNVIATPHGLREVGSLPKFDPMSASLIAGSGSHKLPSNFPVGRRGSIPFSFGNLEEVGSLANNGGGGGGVAASLPALSGFDKESGRIRRRSVRKYYPDEPDAPPKRDYKGKGRVDDRGKGGPMYADYVNEVLEEGEDEDATIPASTFGSSVPITIYRPEKAAAAKPSTNTVVEEDAEEEEEGSIVNQQQEDGTGDIQNGASEEENDEDEDEDDDDDGDRDGSGRRRGSSNHYNHSPPDIFFSEGEIGDGAAGGGRLSPQADSHIFQTDEDHEEMSVTPTVKHRPISISVQAPPPSQSSQQQTANANTSGSLRSMDLSPGQSGSPFSIGSISPGSTAPPAPPTITTSHTHHNLRTSPPTSSTTSSPFSSSFSAGENNYNNKNYHNTQHEQSEKPRLPQSLNAVNNLYHSTHHQHKHHQQQLLNPFLSSPSPYKTTLAARIAAEAETGDDPHGIGSVVGGIDGRTGLDPYVGGGSLSMSLAGAGAGGRRASLATLLSSVKEHQVSQGGGGSLRVRGMTTGAGGGSYLGVGAGGGGSYLNRNSLRRGGMEEMKSAELLREQAQDENAGGIVISGNGGAAGGRNQMIEELALRPERMSFSMRLAVEEHMEKAGRVGVTGRG